MPFLPLDHVSPEIVVMGIMHYPDDSNEHKKKVSEYFHMNFVKSGGLDHKIPAVDERLKDWSVEQSKAELKDLKRRSEQGMITGLLFATYLRLMIDEPDRAAWNLVYNIVGERQMSEGKKGGKRYLRECINEFGGVMHLWAALCLREGFHEELGVGYTKQIDFQYFLHESEILRYHGKQWFQSRIENAAANSHLTELKNPVIPKDAWRVPNDWVPPARQAGWPKNAGEVYYEFAEKDVIPAAKPSGRPKKKT